MSEVLEAINEARAKWNRLMGKETQPRLFDNGPDQRPTNFDLPPAHLGRVWNRLLEGPAESYDLKIVDANYINAVDFLNAWLKVCGDIRRIRSRQIAGARLEYWIE
jgi:hypothetical protein